MQIKSLADNPVKQLFPERNFFNFSSFLGEGVYAVISKVSADISAYESLPKHPLLEKPGFKFGNHQKSLAYPGQVHSNRVVLSEHGGYFPDCDGIITTNRDVVIRIKTADCVPVFLHDPVKMVNGLVHSGWRGTVKRITTKGISKFLEIGSRIQDIKIVLGPSVKLRNYIVQKDVASYFNNHNKEKFFRKWKINLIGEIIDELTFCGIRKNQIFSSEICTVESKDCHSHRRDGNRAGRMFVYLGYV